MNSKRAGHLHQNRHGVFYFWWAIPATISMHFTQREIYRSLRTTSRSNAIMRAQAFGIVTDLLFRKLRAMATNKNDKPIQMDMMMELDFEEGTLKLDVEPHEVEAGKDLITHALKASARCFDEGLSRRLRRRSRQSCCRPLLAPTWMNWRTAAITVPSRFLTIAASANSFFRYWATFRSRNLA